jgi:ribose transport system permease protein
LYLSGDNPRAAAAAGLPVTRTIVIAYVVCSLSAAIGGLLLTARTATGEPNLGGSLALQSIAAAVMGGVPLTGGVGTIASPIFGALLVTILSNWMDLARINGDLQQIVLGLVIVTAVFLDRLRRGRT